MTRIAIISDIHGNKDALQAVLNDAEAQGVSCLFSCGDMTGYYYDTATVWQILSARGAVMCHGNHEQILADWIAGDITQKEAIRKRYGSSYKRAYEDMAPDALEALLALPHPVSIAIDNVRFLISHGAPWDADTYIYPDKADAYWGRLKDYAADYDVICMGHTHYQMFFSHEGLQIINPGSAGQPRSGEEDPEALMSRAQWALYDTDDRSCTLMTSLYDPSNIYAQVDYYDPDLPYLKKVLRRQEIAA